MKTRKLNIIILILLCLICIAGNILLVEIKKSIPELDLTIYDIPIEVKEEEDDEFMKFIEAFEELEHEDYKYYYKFYKKVKLYGVCTCSECRNIWYWPKFPIAPIPNRSVATNPETLDAYTHIKIDSNEYAVYYVDESIPVNAIYIFVDDHKEVGKDWCSGIHDVNIAKNEKLKLEE